MLKLNVIGNYSPNFRGKPCSCYTIFGMTKLIILDMGFGNYKKIVEILENGNYQDIILIISHRHLDHCFDVLFLIFYLKRKNKKITVFIPSNNYIYSILNIFDDVIFLNKLNNNTIFKVDEYTFTFCKTKHKVESYATKIIGMTKCFVYTSDISLVCEDLENFCKEANCVLIDGGNPNINNKFYLNGYHGNTKKILDKLLSNRCGVRKIFVSHLKSYVKDEEYKRVFPENKNIEIAKIGKTYEIM